MNLERLEQAWGKQIVTGDEVSPERIIARMKRETRHAQRRIRGAIVIAALLLVLAWTVAITAHLAGIRPFTPLGLIALVVESLLYLAIGFRAWHSARIVRAELQGMGENTKAALQASLRTIDVQLKNYRIAMVAIPAVVVISICLLAAKYFSGEFPRFGAIYGGIFFAILGTALAAAMWYYRTRRLLPRRQELQQMLHSCDGGA